MNFNDYLKSELDASDALLQREFGINASQLNDLLSNKLPQLEIKRNPMNHPYLTGTGIVFTREVCHQGNVYAVKGQGGTVVGVGTDNSYVINTNCGMLQVPYDYVKAATLVPTGIQVVSGRIQVVSGNSPEGRSLLSNILYPPQREQMGLSRSRRSEHQQRIDEFMRNANQALPTEPCVPPDSVREMRARLILEESLETIEALGFEAEVTYNQGKLTATLHNRRAPSLTEIADGCADISVVTIGTLSACGISDVELLDEVDRSNLAKFGLPTCPKHVHSMVHSKNGLYQCKHPLPGQYCSETAMGPYRREDGKWIKGPLWKPPDIEAVLCRQSPTTIREHLEAVREEGEAMAAAVDKAVQADPLYLAMVKDDIVRPLNDAKLGARFMDANAAESCDLPCYCLGVSLNPSEEIRYKRPPLGNLSVLNASVLAAGNAVTGQDRPGDTTEGMFQLGATGGGVRTPLCGACKGPLSHNLYRNLIDPNKRKDVYRCPNCMDILIAKEITFA